MDNECIFNRFKYKTRDCAFDFVKKTLNKNKLKHLKIAFYNPCFLLCELFYITQLIKSGYIIDEIHIIDTMYVTFIYDLNAHTIINNEFCDVHRFGRCFRQFLEYFHANGYKLKIYVHYNFIDFAIKNKNRINCTIEIDGSTHYETINRFMHASKQILNCILNIKSNSYTTKFYLVTYNTFYVQNVQYIQLNKIIDVLQLRDYNNRCAKNVTVRKLFNLNSLPIIDYKIVNIIKYIDNKIIYMRVLIIIVSIVFVIYIFFVKNKDTLKNPKYTLLFVIEIVFIIYLAQILSLFKSKPLNSLCVKK